jgi:hypothetical protein
MIQEFICHMSMPSQYEHSSFKNRLVRGVLEQSGSFLENICNDLNEFQ